jgi:hypothetical protein
MVAGALGILVALGLADEDKYQLMPSFRGNLRVGVLPKGDADEESLYRAISQFNRQVSLAYKSLDPSPLASLPMDDRLRSAYLDELAFLARRGRTMEMSVGNLELQEVRRLPNELVSVTTTESVALRYLRTADRTEIESHPQASYVMHYLLEPYGAGWKLVRSETSSVRQPGG